MSIRDKGQRTRVRDKFARWVDGPNGLNVNAQLVALGVCNDQAAMLRGLLWTAYGAGYLRAKCTAPPASTGSAALAGGENDGR